MVLYVNMPALLFLRERPSHRSFCPGVQAQAGSSAGKHHRVDTHQDSLLRPNPPLQHASKTEDLETYFRAWNHRKPHETTIDGTKLWSVTIDTGSGGYVPTGYLYLNTGSEWRLAYVQPPSKRSDAVDWTFTPQGTSKIAVARIPMGDPHASDPRSLQVATLDIKTLRHNAAQKRILK